MNIAIDISPLKTGNFLSHRVRGTGQYLESLRSALEKYFPQNKYKYFTKKDKVPFDSDIIHYPYFEPFFLTLPWSINKKSVVTVHDLTPFVFPANFPVGIKGKLKWKIQKKNLIRAGCIITDSDSSKKDIMRFTGIEGDKIEVVYLAAGEDFKVLEKSVLEKVQSKYGLPQEFALYVGDVTWNKNLPRLLEAARIANVPLVLVGKAISEREFDQTNAWNSDRVEVRKLAEANKNVIITGFVSSEELVSFYNLATVFVMPSIYEGFGLPVLEAMSCGCPVVTSRGGSIPEIAQHAALYVDEKNPEDIARGLLSVYLDSNLREKMRQRGLKQSAKFNWKKTAEKTIEAYKKLL